MKRHLLHILFILIISSNPAYGLGSETSSLIANLAYADNDSTRISLLNAIGMEFRHSFPDSSLQYLNQALELFNKGTDRDGLSPLLKARTLRNIGVIHRVQGRYHESLENLYAALKINTENRNLHGESLCYNNIGNVYANQGVYDKALETFIRSLNICSSLGDKLGVSDRYVNIGFVFEAQGFYEKALEYYYKSLTILHELTSEPTDDNSTQLKLGLSSRLLNIGVAHWHLDDTEKAIDYYHQSLELKLEVNDKRGASQAYNNIAIVYCNKGDYDSGIYYFKKSLELKEDIGDRNGESMVLGNLAYLNTLKADFETTPTLRRKYLSNAIKYGRTSYEIAKEIGSLSLENEASGYLMEAYIQQNQLGKAIKYAREHIQTQGEIHSKARTDALAEMATRYETERKQLQIGKMEQERVLNEEIITKQRIVILSSIFGLFVIVVFIFMLMRIIRIQKRANYLLSSQNEEINQQKEEIMAQRDEIETHRNRTEQQKDEIQRLYQLTLEQIDSLESQQDHIENSIEYAKIIQSSLLPNLQSFFKQDELNINSYFLVFHPKETVSGDFYWITKVNDHVVITVVDCTGHGVPGALMSMLGISFLNQIVNKDKITDPALILEGLRTTLIDALKQTDRIGTQRDGMEMNIAVINTKTLHCHWAGAKNPMWIVRGSSIDSKIAPTKRVEVVKPDLMPISAHFKMSGYTKKEIQLHKGDRLYLFSDGFGDQFGGPNNKKYNRGHALMRLIGETSILPIKEQGATIDNTFTNWISYNGYRAEQIDDVTILGVEI